MALKVYAPASIGNFSVGYDLLGAAVKPIDGSLLGDVIEISEATSNQFACEGLFADELPEDVEQNIIFDCLQNFNNALQAKNISPEPLSFVLHKNLPVGSGLGSSASSIVAMFNGLNEWYQKPLNQKELLLLMGKLEGAISGSVHYDNVAPSYLGGLQLSTNDEDISSNLPFPKDWYLVMANPGISISTAAAREILPKAINQATAIEYASRSTNFCNALHNGDAYKAASFIEDVIAEPYRMKLIPDFLKHKAAAVDAGALAFGISGSGSSIFALTDKLECAQSIENYLNQNYKLSERAFCHVCQLDFDGSRKI